MIGEVLAEPSLREGKAGAPVPSRSKLSPHAISLATCAFQDFDLTVHAGEIVGIAGVAGNGQDELALAITGLGDVACGKHPALREPT